MYNIIIKKGAEQTEKGAKTEERTVRKSAENRPSQPTKNRSSPKILKKSARAEKQKKGCHSPQKSPQPKGSL